MGEDGTEIGRRKIMQLARNTRRHLAQVGLFTYGHKDSPVVPLLVYLVLQDWLRTQYKMLESQHDNETTGWSPQGRLLQVEYAMEAVKRGTVTVGLKSKDYAVLVALCRASSDVDSLERKISAAVRTLTTRHIAVVAAGFPATPIMEGRIHFSVSPAPAKEQLDYALEAMDKIADDLGLKYSSKPRDPNPSIY